MLKVAVALTEHPLVVSVVVKVTVLIPGVEYVTPLGFSSVEVAGVAPAPKFQLQVTLVVLPVLVKSTAKPVHLGVVETNEAVLS
jgi:hypothetical protein